MTFGFSREEEGGRPSVAADKGDLNANSTQPSPGLGLSVFAGVTVGFLVSGGEWRLRELASTSLEIVPTTMSISVVAGGIAAIGWFLLRRGSPTLAGICSRALLPLWSLVLFLSPMFVYDAKTFGYDWFRAMAWAAVALILAGLSYRLLGRLYDWLHRGHVKRVTWVILVAAVLLWVPFVIRFVFP